MKLNYIMPAEYEPHQGCIMVWPSRPGSWSYGAKAARKAFAEIIKAIAQSEKVFVAVWPDDDSQSSARIYLSNISNVELFTCQTNDAWARDIGPTFVYEVDGSSRGQLSGISWSFNAWGGSFDGLYGDYDKDDEFALEFCQRFGYNAIDASHFVLEGGSVHSDGEGTLLVTEACLLSKGRNPSLSKAEIESQLNKYLGAKKVLWLPRGIYNDETNEHVDNICAFIGPAEVVLAWTDNEADPQYELSCADYEYLQNQTDAKGRRISIHKLLIPEHPICMSAEDVAGFSFTKDEDTREVGERLAASYVNFYFSNDAVIMPVFGGENAASDERAVALMQKWLPDRKIIPIYARDILMGGGNIHCITQQIPF